MSVSFFCQGVWCQMFKQLNCRTPLAADEVFGLKKHFCFYRKEACYSTHHTTSSRSPRIKKNCLLLQKKYMPFQQLKEKTITRKLRGKSSMSKICKRVTCSLAATVAKMALKKVGVNRFLHTVYYEPQWRYNQWEFYSERLSAPLSFCFKITTSAPALWKYKTFSHQNFLAIF